MNSYSDILGLHEYFQPAYDLTDERHDYWKRFIPNEKFFAVLRGVLNSFEHQEPHEKKSLWMQGTYGTGKSHATAVLKHLLFDDFQTVQEYVSANSKFEDVQLKSRLLSFREKNRVFPVVLKGVSTISNHRTFALVIEKAVKQALRQSQIEVNTGSDFERMIHHIQTNPGHINWDNIIQSSQLKMYVSDKDALIKKLHGEDLDIIKHVETLSAEIGIHFSHEDITSWLKEVTTELKQQGKADHLMIFWDEFTSVLELPNSGVLLSALQDIAELSAFQGIFLFMVSHRLPSQAKIAKDDMEKVRGRFKELDYSMEPITTYHIIGASIRKDDVNTWEQLRDEQSKVFNALVPRIVGTDSGIKDYNLLRDLFPIHPYTAYLATFIARNIGSTERSIFHFLYDENKGFRHFINTHPTHETGIFLTADFLWDFFMQEFERIDYQRFASILERYTLHIERVEGEDSSYSAIFKGILLLNVQYKMVSVTEAKETLVAPSLDNINFMFYGTEYARKVEPALEFFHEQQIIAKNPDNLFLIASSALPHRQVEKEKETLRNSYDSIEKILSKKHVEELQQVFTSYILRQTELKLFDASHSEALLKSKLKKAFKERYSLHIAVLIARNIQEREQSKTIGKRILEDSEFENIIIVVFEELLTEQVSNQFIDYLARAKVAERLTLKDEQNTNEEFAQKILGQWIQSLKSGYVEWFVAEKNHSEENRSADLFGKRQGKVLINDFSDIANNALSGKIFPFGLENLQEVKKNQNAWNFQRAKSSAESFLFADNRECIEQKTASGPSRYTREILKNNLGVYVVDETLTFKNDIDPAHPLFKMAQEVEHAIARKKNASVFNLGDTLEFLTSPPFGLYPNMVNFAALGFLMRAYVGKLYESGKGKPIEKEMMRDKILDIYNYWQSGKGGNKLEVRLGTEDEKQLLKELSDIFGLTALEDFKDDDRKIESLSDVRWGIRTWIKQSQFPLWVFKLSDHATQPIIAAIEKIIALVETRDVDISHTDITTTRQAVKQVETDLKLFIFKPEQSRNLFVKWLRSIEDIEVPDEKIEHVIHHIRQNMPTEIGVEPWKESKVRETALIWYIKDRELSQPKPPAPPTTVPPKSYPPPSEPPQPPTVKEDQINARIEAYSGDMKEFLKKIVQEHPEIIAVLEQYL